MKYLKVVSFIVVGLFLMFTIYAITSPAEYITDSSLKTALQSGEINEKDSITIIPRDLKKDTLMGDIVHVDDPGFAFNFLNGTEINYNEEMTFKYHDSKNVMGIWIVTLKGENK